MRRAYRDHLEGLRARVDERRARVRELESRVDFALLARVAPGGHADLCAAARHIDDVAEARIDDAWLERLDAKLAAYEVELLGLAGRAPELELRARTPQGEPPDAPLHLHGRLGGKGGLWAAALDEVQALPEALRKGLGHVANLETHWVERPEPKLFNARASLRARFIAGEGPIAMGITIVPMNELLRYHLTFVTTVARGLPAVLVIPRTSIVQRIIQSFDGTSKTFGPEVPTGQDAFDGTFSARCVSPTMVLGALLRAPLLRLARFDVPVLRSGGGVATLTYEYDPEPGPLRAALDVLAALRSIELSLSIVKRA